MANLYEILSIDVDRKTKLMLFMQAVVRRKQFVLSASDTLRAEFPEVLKLFRISWLILVSRVATPRIALRGASATEVHSAIYRSTWRR